MKKLILKELREHFKVALLGLAVLTVMLFLAFQSCGTQTQQAALSRGNNAKELQPLLSQPVLIQVAFFCAIFGTLLGWLQIRAEKHPDLWAFLVHRPVTRTTIFRGKVVSGLLLYVVGAGPPLLSLVVVASIPGKVAAPFTWAMVLPLTAIFFSGMVFYFAGLLTGLRKARWFASRGFGLGLAVMTSIGVIYVGEFWQALLIIVVAGVVLALAVWGSFQTGGHYCAQPKLGKLALTVASVVSVVLLLFVVVGFTISLITPSSDYSSSYYQVLKDGSIARIIQHAMGRATEDVKIVDLNGKPLVDEKTGRVIKFDELHQRSALGLGATVNFDNALGKRYRIRPGYSDAARFFAPWRVLNKTIWYLTADGRLVAYHGITRREVGNLEPPGNMTGGAADDTRFLRPNDYTWSYLREYTRPDVLASARTAYTVDLEKRELKPFFSVTNGDTIGGYADSWSPYASGSPDSAVVIDHYAVVITRTSIQWLNVDGGTSLQLPYEPAHPVFPTVTVHRLEKGNSFAVRFDPDYLLNAKSGGKLLSHIKWTNPDGTVRNTMDLPKLPELRRNDLSERLSIPLLPPGIPFYSWDEPYRISQVLRIVPAILCALIGWWLARRNNFSLKARVGWGIFNFLFGIPGLLAFLAVQEWPARELCPKCRKLRAVNREQCEYCGADFAPPAKTGIEIFEPLTTK